MRLKAVLCLLFLTGCRHLGLAFEPPGILRAVVEGEIKGMAIYCEKTITLGRVNWEVMCKVSDDIDIKYRTKTLNDRQLKLEMLIDKKLDNGNKVIAAPVMIVNKGRAASFAMTSEKSRIDIKAEPVR